MRERIDRSDPRELLRQLRRLAASRLGRRLQLGELVLVEPYVAQLVIDLDSALEKYLDDVAREEGVDPEEVRTYWRGLRMQIVRKSTVRRLEEFSEVTRLIMAAPPGARRGEEAEEQEAPETGEDYYEDEGEEPWF